MLKAGPQQRFLCSPSVRTVALLLSKPWTGQSIRAAPAFSNVSQILPSFTGSNCAGSAHPFTYRIVVPIIPLKVSQLIADALAGACLRVCTFGTAEDVAKWWCLNWKGVYLWDSTPGLNEIQFEEQESRSQLARCRGYIAALVSISAAHLRSCKCICVTSFTHHPQKVIKLLVFSCGYGALRLNVLLWDLKEANLDRVCASWCVQHLYA